MSFVRKYFLFVIGYPFIKRIVEGSTADRMKSLIKIGDHIERINDKSVVGIRHFEVAQILKGIPVVSTFKLRLVEPNSFGFRKIPSLNEIQCRECLIF